MTEARRLIRNATRLGECHPWFRDRLERVLSGLESRGYRPRIQDAWRSPERQKELLDEGFTKVRWGFHNATKANGAPDSLAADVLDDDFPLNPRRAFLLALAQFADEVDLDTGIAWGLPPAIAQMLNEAIADGASWKGKLGWDPCHVEVADLTIADARRGKRP